jgi:hypothetical protein
MQPTAEHQGVLDAIETVKQYLQTEWIVEGCKDERVLCCASCTMTRLSEDLDMLVYEIESLQLSA